eukprot:tig00021617_g22941.t1
MLLRLVREAISSPKGSASLNRLYAAFRSALEGAAAGDADAEAEAAAWIRALARSAWSLDRAGVDEQLLSLCLREQAWGVATSSGGKVSTAFCHLLSVIGSLGEREAVVQSAKAQLQMPICSSKMRAAAEAVIAATDVAPASEEEGSEYKESSESEGSGSESKIEEEARGPKRAPRRRKAGAASPPKRARRCQGEAAPRRRHEARDHGEEPEQLEHAHAEVEEEALAQEWDGEEQAESAGALWALPDELQRMVLDCLGPTDLAALSMTSRYWRAAASEPRLWMQLYAARFGLVWCCARGGAKKEGHTGHRWKELYGARVAGARQHVESSARRTRSPWKAAGKSAAAIREHGQDAVPEPPFMRAVKPKWIPCDHSRPPACLPWAHGSPQWAGACGERFGKFADLHRHLKRDHVASRRSAGRGRAPPLPPLRTALPCSHPGCQEVFANERARARHLGEKHDRWPAGVPLQRRRASAGEASAGAEAGEAEPAAATLFRCEAALADGSACGRQFATERGGVRAEYVRGENLTRHIGARHEALAASLGIRPRARPSDAEAEAAAARRRRRLSEFVHVEKTEEGARRCPAPGCPRTFAQTSTQRLRRHLLEAHPELVEEAERSGGELSRRCGVCGAGFAGRDELARHELGEHGAGRFPLVCEEPVRVVGVAGKLACGYGCFTAHGLRVHAASKLHAATAPYFMCPVRPHEAPGEGAHEPCSGPARRWAWNRPGFPRCYALLATRDNFVRHLKKVHGLAGPELRAAQAAAARPAACAADASDDEGGGAPLEEAEPEAS